LTRVNAFYGIFHAGTSGWFDILLSGGSSASWGEPAAGAGVATRDVLSLVARDRCNAQLEFLNGFDSGAVKPQKAFMKNRKSI